MRRTRLSCTAARAGVMAGLALLVASGGAQARAPRKVAYVAVRGSSTLVRVMNLDGSHNVLLGAGWSAKISPDGTKVAIVEPYRTRGTMVLVAPADGRPGRLFARAANGAVNPIAWSPDSTRLAVVVSFTQLVVVDAANGTAKTIARGQILGASFSPDSSQIVYGRSPYLFAPDVDVFVARVDGSDAHAITHDGRSELPLWGPTRIAFTHVQPRPSDASVFQLRTMRPDGSGVHQLTHMRIPPLLSGLTPTAWSADGTRLLAEYVGQDTSEAWTVDLRSGHARDLTGRSDDVVGCGLSPDGRTVLVQLGFVENLDQESIATIPFGGGRAKVLARHATSPSWSG